jgi:hypothetical protein
MATPSEQIGTDDETLIRTAGLEMALAEANIQRLRATRHAAFYRMTQKYGIAETARRTGTSVSNVKYFALRGESHA